jgi:hypothetical protein
MEGRGEKKRGGDGRWEERRAEIEEWRPWWTRNIFFQKETCGVPNFLAFPNWPFAFLKRTFCTKFRKNVGRVRWEGLKW